MSNNLWNRVADFFKEWDGEDMTKSMLLYVDELREINSNRIELIRMERERKEIRNKAIEEALEKSAKAICIGCGYLNGHECTYNGANCGVSKPMLETVTKALEQMNEVGE